MKRWMAAFAVLLVTVSGCELPVDEPISSAQVIPSISSSLFEASWTRTTSLILNDNGRYRLITDFGNDRGQWSFDSDESHLRLDTAGGRLCNEGASTTWFVDLAPHPSEDATALRLNIIANQCEERGEIPGLFYIEGDVPDGLVGMWDQDIAVTFGPDSSYSIVTQYERDVGTYEVDFSKLLLTTAGGDVCDVGNVANLFAATTGWFRFDAAEDDCPWRALLAGRYQERG